MEMSGDDGHAGFLAFADELHRGTGAGRAWSGRSDRAAAPVMVVARKERRFMGK
jgi:hypothetical protein